MSDGRIRNLVVVMSSCYVSMEPMSEAAAEGSLRELFSFQQSNNSSRTMGQISLILAGTHLLALI